MWLSQILTHSCGVDSLFSSQADSFHHEGNHWGRWHSISERLHYYNENGVLGFAQSVRKFNLQSHQLLNWACEGQRRQREGAPFSKDPEGGKNLHRSLCWNAQLWRGALTWALTQRWLKNSSLFPTRGIFHVNMYFLLYPDFCFEFAQ